jgi:WD40 repeat protein
LRKLLNIIVFGLAILLIVWILQDYIKSQKSQKKGSEKPLEKSISADFVKKECNLIQKLIEKKAPSRGSVGIKQSICTVRHRAAITGLLFLDEGRRLISSSKDKTIKIWDISDLSHPSLIHNYSKICRFGELSAFSSMAISLSRNLFGVVRTDGNSNVLEVLDLENGFKNPAAYGHIRSFAFSQDGKCIAAGLISGEVKIQRVIYLVSGAFKVDLGDAFKFTEHTRPVTSVSFSKDRFASASEDQTVRLYHFNKFNLLKVIKHINKVTAIAFSPDSQYLVTASLDNRILLYDKEGNFKREFVSQKTPPRSLCFSPDGNVLLVGSFSESCSLYSFPEGVLICEFTGHESPVTALACTLRDGKTIVATGDQQNGDIIFWDEKGQIISIIEGNMRNVYTLGLSEDLRIAFGMNPDSSYLDQAIDLKTLELSHFVHEEDFQKRRESTENIYLEKPIITPDMEPLMPADALDVCSHGFKARILRTECDGYEHTCSTFIGDSFLAIGGRDGSLSIYSKLGNKIFELRGHEGDILDLVSSKKDEWLVSSSSDGTVRLWSLDNLESRRRSREFSNKDWYLLDKYFSKAEIQLLKEKVDGMSSEDINKKAIISYLSSLAYGTDVKDPIMTIFSTQDGKWVLWNYRGFFASDTAELWDSVGYFVYSKMEEENPEFLPFSQLYDSYFRPDFVRSLFEKSLEQPIYRQVPDVLRFDIERTEVFKNPPPITQIVSPEDGEVVNTDVVHVRVKIENPFGKIGDIRLYHNGKLISSDGVYNVYNKGRWVPIRVMITGPKVPTLYGEFVPYLSPVEKTYQVNLVPGDNIIACQAKNSTNHILSRMAKVTVKCNLEEKRPKLYLLGIGCQNFKNKELNLKTPHNDARRIAEVLEKYRESVYIGCEVVTLLDPGKQQIKESIFKLKDMIRPEDTFIFFASTHGHAIRIPSIGEDYYEYYLITSDCSKELTEDVAISTKELLEFSKLIPALRQVYILDTCHAGAAHKEFAKVYSQKLMVFGMGGGMHIMAAASPLGIALDNYFGNGLFTYYLLEALSGMGDEDNDRAVTSNEAVDYIRGRIEQYFKGIQKPEIFNYGPSVIIKQK